MKATHLPVLAELDAALEQLRRGREHVAAWPASGFRDGEVARAYELEAQLWSVLLETADNRLIWRAALAAEAHARAWAAQYRSLLGAAAELGGAA